MCVLVTQSCLVLCNPVDCSPPVSSVHGILQARILEWVAIPFSRGSSQPRDQTWVSCTAGGLYNLSHQGSPDPTDELDEVEEIKYLVLLIVVLCTVESFGALYKKQKSQTPVFLNIHPNLITKGYSY